MKLNTCVLRKVHDKLAPLSRHIFLSFAWSTTYAIYHTSYIWTQLLKDAQSDNAKRSFPQWRRGHQPTRNARRVGTMMLAAKRVKDSPIDLCTPPPSHSGLQTGNSTVSQDGQEGLDKDFDMRDRVRNMWKWWKPILKHL